LTLIIYNLLIWIYSKAILLASNWSPKAKQWVKGRKNIFENLSIAIAKINPEDNAQFIWMHCASLGEFEQGRPVLENLKKSFPEKKILLTFFSPSGYEVRKNYQGADLVFYLPTDTKKNAVTFLNIVKPSLVIFVKYEFWFHYLHQLKKRSIPTILISAIFRKQQPFFKWYGRLHRYMLSCFTQVFVQNSFSKQLLSDASLGMNIMVSGDTRFDRVSDIHSHFTALPEIEKFVGQTKTIIAGSTWSEDEELLQHLHHSMNELKLIIAPHEIHDVHIAELKKRFPNALLFSQLKPETESSSANCLIIDNIGMLSKLYHYAYISYIGGGFNKSGIHNILEAAVYNKPVIFGPVYSKFKEANDLLETGGAFSVKDNKELEKVVERLVSETEIYRNAANLAGNYVKENTGATKLICNYIQENRLLTS
jgi:3-deoxy-D-manno-octulosonic-acid transferase